MADKIVIFLFLLIASITDVKKKRISNRLLLLFALCTIFLFFFKCQREAYSIGKYVPWGMIPGILSLVLGRVSHESIGYGDGYLISMVGTLVGMKGIIFIIMSAFSFMLIYAVPLFIIKKVHWKTEVPFVPAIFLAYLTYCLI